MRGGEEKGREGEKGEKGENAPSATSSGSPCTGTGFPPPLKKGRRTDLLRLVFNPLTFYAPVSSWSGPDPVPPGPGPAARTG